MSNEIDVSRQLEWEATSHEDFFFKPKKEMLKIRNTVPTGKVAIYREKDLDEGSEIIPISVVGDNYHLIENEKLDDNVRAFDKLPLLLNYELSGALKNKRFNLVYDLNVNEDYGSDKDDGGDMKPKLVVKNSYDGSSQLHLIIGLFRMICSNMVIIPIANKVSSFQMKHYNSIVRSPKNVREKIEMFLEKSLSDEAIKGVRDVVLQNKAADDEKVMAYGFFKSLPFKTLFPILQAINRFSEVPVTVSKGDNAFFLDKDEGVDRLLTHVLGDKMEGDKDKIKDGIDQYHNMAAVKYGEDVKNHWQLYNLMLKIVQYYTHKQRRIIVAQQLGNSYF